MEPSLVKSARQFVRNNRQGFGREMLDLWQKIEVAILRRRLAEPVPLEGEETPTDPIVEELAELRARLRRIEDLLDSLGTAEEEVGPQRPPPQPAKLAPGEEFGADRYISPFNGFYPTEPDPSVGAFRWTGPTNEFLFHLDVDRAGKVQFELQLLGAMRPEQCEGIALIADGLPVPLDFTRAGGAYNVRFELAPAKGRNLTLLLFIVPRLYRPVDLGSGDDIRLLGVRFRALKMLR